MKVYGPGMAGNFSGDLVSISDKSGRLFEFFIMNSIDGKFLKFSTPRGEAQERLAKEAIKNLDYLEGNIGIPIFSLKARDLFQKEFPDEVEFYDIDILVQGDTLKFSLCKTKLFLDLLDENLTSFRLLQDGSRIITGAVYRTAFERSFYIARDRNYLERWVVSERFVKFCEINKLAIVFGKPI